MEKLLIINPGSTSTKIAVYEGLTRKFSENISHPLEELKPFPTIIDQTEYRTHVITDCLERAGAPLSAMDGIIGIGGLLKSVDSGVYRVNEAMLADLRSHTYGEHAANLGAVIADALAKKLGKPAYIADPIPVDEMQPVARISGHPLLPRYGRAHTLNHKRVARTVAEELGKPYEQCRLVVAHLGGGISIAAHAEGRMIDSTTSRSEGTFSMDRSGQLNCWELAKLCFSGKYEKQQVLKMLNGEGGVSAYLGTKDFRDVEARRDEGDATAAAVFEALAYQVSGDYMRWIGYFFIFMGIKMATDGVLRGLGIMRPFLIANMVNLAIRLSVALIFAPRFGIAFVWLAVPAGWLANFLISYVALRRSWPTDK